VISPGPEPQPRRPRVPRADDRRPGDDVMQGPAPVPQQDAGEPQSREQEAQRDRQCAHDRPGARLHRCCRLSRPARRTAPCRRSARGPAVGEVDEPQAAYAMITQMPPLFQVMSLPVSTLAANEMAARVSMNTPALTPTSAAKAAKRDAKPAHLPCRPSRMTAGGPGGWGIARTRSHSPALGHSRSGGPGGPVYGRRRSRPIQRAMNSSSPTVWLRTMPSNGLDKGTASGDSGLRTAVLPPPAVRMGVTVRPVAGRARCAGSICSIFRPRVSASHGQYQRYTAVTRQ
jgi:hypothetical protein